MPKQRTHTAAGTPKIQNERAGSWWQAKWNSCITAQPANAWPEADNAGAPKASAARKTAVTESTLALMYARSLFWSDDCDRLCLLHSECGFQFFFVALRQK